MRYSLVIAVQLIVLTLAACSPMGDRAAERILGVGTAITVTVARAELAELASKATSPATKELLLEARELLALVERAIASGSWSELAERALVRLPRVVRALGDAVDGK